MSGMEGQGGQHTAGKAAKAWQARPTSITSQCAVSSWEAWIVHIDMAYGRDSCIAQGSMR